MSPTFLRAGITMLLLVTCLVWQTASAMAMPTSPDQLRIINVEVNMSSNQITIKGENFGTEVPTITLAETSLHIVTNSATEIVADLPAGIRAGTYTFEVSRDGGATEAGKDRSSIIVPN